MHADGRARAGDAVNVDRAADRLDVRAHDVHADATARDARHGRRGGEARFEDELQHAVGRHRRRLRGGHKPPGDRLLADFFERDSAAVVGDLDRHPAALVEGPQREPARPRLSGGHAGRGRLDAVVDRVADEMRERIADALDQRPIELGVGAVDRQLHLLAAGDGKVADRSWEAAEDVLDRLEPRPNRGFLEGVGHGVDPLAAGLHGGVVAVDAPQLVAGEHQFADEVEDRGQQADVDPDGRLDDAGPGRGRRSGAGNRLLGGDRRLRLGSGRGRGLLGRYRIRGNGRNWRGGRRRGRAGRQRLVGRYGRERAGEVAVVVLALTAGLLDRPQDRAHGIDHRIQ